MGSVKAFAMWLAECIYLHQWSDEQIITSITTQHPDGQRLGVQIWLREQINIVKENPSLYKSMLDKQGE
jgi:hypothetical protein